MADPSELPILARLEEAEAITANMTEVVTSQIAALVEPETLPALAIGGSPCFDIVVPVGAPENAANRVLQAVCFALENLLGDASGVLGDLLAKASDGLNGVIGEVQNLVAGLTGSIVGALEDIIGTITDTLDRSVTSILGTAEGVVRSIGDFVASLVARIDAGIQAVLDVLAFTVQSINQTIIRVFDAIAASTTALIDRINATVRSVGEFLVELARSTLDAMALSVAAVLGPLVGAGQSVLARLGDLIESVPGAVKDAAGAIAEGVGEFVGVPLNALGNIFVTQVESFFGDLIEEGNLSHGEIIRSLLTRLGAPADVVETFAVAADDATPSTPAFTAMALSFLIPLLLAQIIGGAMDPVVTQLQQRISSDVRQTLISPADLLDGFFKGDIPESRFRTDFEQAGFTEERVSQLVALFRRAPDVNVQIQAWLRGLIEESELDTALAANRLRGNDIALLKQVVFFIPPAQDLIQMAVREVFSPDVRERFGQDEDFPEAFATFALQQGISDEWARNYWAAHWALPSPAQGFEMLHRGVIEVEDLNVLLRALDVMPFWRDKLTQIAFSPLTRVDLRRMHALGLLTDKDLQTRYEAIGFGADDAALMVAFTVAFNFSEDRLPEELEGLTRATVLNLFEDGLVERDEAVEFLARMGIGDEAAELFVEQRELETSRRERRDLIESVVQLAGGGRISLPLAQDSLANIGVTAVESARAIQRILASRDSRDRLPTIASLTKMFKREIIDADLFLDTLKAHGFDDDWAAREFELLTVLPDDEITGDV